ncbi:hypothetical protein [Streptomonospora litoralis]|uniref:Uncharacterized protein n=1 Tax=Streptomonospora litoralis TaxID=2498135 RepID=A0A4P6Q5K7_9ACTN|nr:hypothetical protein [Streptomonospora litoralis]QBI55560.1 hypothetical protein EKD16_18985 [Streptomonospora litoralis]
MGEGGRAQGRSDRSMPLARREGPDEPAQQLRASGRRYAPNRPAPSAGAARDGEDPDVLLEVPDLQVEELDLDVDDLRARVSLNAEVADLLKLHVGADVDLGRVALNLKGVQAQAHLRVRLDHVAAMVERVLATIEENPQLAGSLHTPLAAAANEAADAAGGAVSGTGEVRAAESDSAEHSTEDGARPTAADGDEQGPAESTEQPVPSEHAEPNEQSAEPESAAEAPSRPLARDAPAEHAEEEALADPAEEHASEPEPARSASQRRPDRPTAARKVVGGVIAGARRSAERDSAPRKLGRSVRAGARQVGKEAGGVMYRAVKAARDAE